MNDETAAGPRWPGGARCAVTFALHFDGPSVEVGRGELPLGIKSHGRYAARCGVPRYIELFESLGVPLTFFVPGYDAEQYPELVRRIAAGGHEIAAHGYLHEGHDPGDAEPDLLRRAHAILSDLTGKPPRGWCSPGGHKSVQTVRTLRELGYVYDASDKDQDLPYVAPASGLLILPNNTSSLDDFPFYWVSRTPPSEVLAQWIDEFDAIHAEGGFYHLMLHPRTGYGSGSPARAAIVPRLIEHMRARGGVHFSGMLALAEWCLHEPQRWRQGGTA